MKFSYFLRCGRMGKLELQMEKERGWSLPINVSAFTSKLTKINKVNGNKVVPVIKLAKSLFNR